MGRKTRLTAEALKIVRDTLETPHSSIEKAAKAVGYADKKTLYTALKTSGYVVIKTLRKVDLI